MDQDRLRQLAGVQSAQQQNGDDGRVIAQADEFTVQLDADGTVHLLDGEQTVRVSMPQDVWDELTKVRDWE